MVINYQKKYEEAKKKIYLHQVYTGEIKYIEVFDSVLNFYLIENLKLMISQSPKFDIWRPSHKKLWDDIEKYKEMYDWCFARAIYDYIVLIVAAEMRHAPEYCETYYKNYKFHRNDYSRSEVYGEVDVVYQPQDILRAGVFLFSKDWDSAYGGPKWGQIAKSGTYYGKMKDSIFIDHCVDLSHNNSTFFDKGAGIFTMRTSTDSYQCLLQYKYETSGEEFFGIYDNKIINPVVRKFIERAYALGLTKFKLPEMDWGYVVAKDYRLFQNVLDYQPIEWVGKERFDYTLAYGHYNHEDRRRYVDDYDDDYDNRNRYPLF